MSNHVSRSALQQNLAQFGYERVLEEAMPGRNRAEHGYVDTFVATDRSVVLAHSDISGTVDHVRAVRQLNGPSHRTPTLALEEAAATQGAPLSLDDVTHTIHRIQADRDARQGARSAPVFIADVRLDLPHDHDRLRRARVLDDDVSSFDRRATTKYDTAGITVERARRLPGWARKAISFADPADRNAERDIQNASRALEQASADLPNSSKTKRSETSTLIQNHGMADPRSAEYIAFELREMADQMPNKRSASYGGLVRAIDATDAHAAGSVADEVAENSPRATDAQRLEGMIRQWTDERMHGARTPETPHAPPARNARLLAHHERRMTQYSVDLIERVAGTTEAISLNAPDGRGLANKAKGVLAYFRNGQEISPPGETAERSQPIGAGRVDADAGTGELDARIDAFARRAETYRANHTHPADSRDARQHVQLRLAAADLHGSARMLDARMKASPDRRLSPAERSAGSNPVSAVRAWTKPVAGLPGSAGAQALRERAQPQDTARKVRGDSALEM